MDSLVISLCRAHSTNAGLPGAQRMRETGRAARPRPQHLSDLQGTDEKTK